MNDIREIKTTRGILHYYRDFERYDGGIVMQDAKTIGRYKEIMKDHPDPDEYGVFFAFSREQFAKGYTHLVELGKIKDGEKIYQDANTGAYGTEEGLKGFFDYYTKRDKLVVQECDPQEVYFYEYNNHESQIAWDGDNEAYRIIINYWGEDVAKTIKRY